MNREDHFKRITVALARLEREMTFAHFRPEEWGLTLTHAGYDRMLSLVQPGDVHQNHPTKSPRITGVTVTVVRELGQ